VIREDQADVTFWRFAGPRKQQRNVRIRPCFSSNDGQVVRGWCAAGLGVAVRSEWDVAEDLAAGRLIEVLPQWRLPNADVVALVGSRTERVLRTSRFLESLAQALYPAPWRRTASLTT
jgi:DNA-binding transcriptional LysR family regulator